MLCCFEYRTSKSDRQGEKTAESCAGSRVLLATSVCFGVGGLRFLSGASMCGQAPKGATGARSVDRPSLPVFVPLLGTLKRCLLDRQAHKLANGFLKLLLLLPIVHHHERVDPLFPPLHGVIVAHFAGRQVYDDAATGRPICFQPRRAAREESWPSD